MRLMWTISPVQKPSIGAGRGCALEFREKFFHRSPMGSQAEEADARRAGVIQKVNHKPVHNVQEVVSWHLKS